MVQCRLFGQLLVIHVFTYTIISYTASNNEILPPLYGNYLMINVGCDGTWRRA